MPAKVSRSWKPPAATPEDRRAILGPLVAARRRLCSATDVLAFPLHLATGFVPGPLRAQAIPSGRTEVDMLLRLIVGVTAAWISPDPVPKQPAPSAYEERCTEPRCHLRLVR